jgi:hypothetical protein
MACVVKRLAVLVVAIVSGEVAPQESASSLRLHVGGAADSSNVEVAYMLYGPFGGYGSRLRATAKDIDIPIVVEGRWARSLKAIVFSPGFHTARIEVPDVTAQSDLRVVLDPLPIRRLTGRVEFVGGAKPRSFVLDIDVMVGSSQEFFGIADGLATVFDVAEAAVSAKGDFSVAISDLAEDGALQSPVIPSVFRFHARDATTRNFVFELTPDEIAIRDLPQTLILSAAR